jgi:hypothetical protein
MDQKKPKTKPSKKAEARAKLPTLDLESLEHVVGGGDPASGLPTGKRM